MGSTAPRETPLETAAGLPLADLHAWLWYQFKLWRDWTAENGDGWLAMPTGNPTFPTLGRLFGRAFTPLHRFSDQALGAEPITPPDFSAADWPALQAWAERCLARDREACRAALVSDPTRTLHLKTRSAGELTVRMNHGLAHAAMHCYWHLAGVTHLLRAAGIEPPQHTDLLFWAAKQMER